MMNMTTGSNGVCLGYNAGANITPGQNSTAIGTHALSMSGTYDFIVIIATKYTGVLGTKEKIHHLLVYNIDNDSVLNMSINTPTSLWQAHICGKCNRHPSTSYLVEIYNTYEQLLPNWLLLYYYFYTNDSIGCKDVFTHLITFYPASLKIKNKMI